MVIRPPLIWKETPESQWHNSNRGGAGEFVFSETSWRCVRQVAQQQDHRRPSSSGGREASSRLYDAWGKSLRRGLDQDLQSPVPPPCGWSMNSSGQRRRKRLEVPAVAKEPLWRLPRAAKPSDPNLIRSDGTYFPPGIEDENGGGRRTENGGSDGVGCGHHCQLANLTSTEMH
jgi:hypothetical protein